MKFRESRIKHYYELELRFDVSSFSNKAKNLMDSVNSTMHNFGFNENISLMSGPISIEITSNKKLNRDQIEHIRRTYHDHFQKAGHKVTVSDIKYIGVNT